MRRTIGVSRLCSRRRYATIVVVLGVAALGLAGVAAAGQQAGSASSAHALALEGRSGHPPALASARIDGQRRLIVTYTAADGMTYGGHLYFDNDPRDAEPGTGDPQYGSFMYCNNKSTCLARWDLAASPATGPFSYTSDPLDCRTFPVGTYWVQVEGYNEDPYPSTRQWEESNVASVQLPACGTTTGKTETGTTTPRPAARIFGYVVVSGQATASYTSANGDDFTGPVAGRVALVPGEFLVAGSRAITLAVKEGRLVLDKGGQLLVPPREDELVVLKGQLWYSGFRGFKGKPYKIVGVAAAQPVGRAVFTFETCVYPPGAKYCANRVRVYSGKVDVSRGSPNERRPDEKKHVVLEAGFEALVLAKGPPTSPKRYSPPPRPFWNP